MMGSEEQLTPDELRRRHAAMAKVQQHPDLVEKRSEIASHHAEAVKKIAEAASQLLNSIFKDRVSLSPFTLSGVMNEKLDLLSSLLINQENLTPDARADIKAVYDVTQTVKWRIRQVSQSNAYDDEKGPYYYWKLASLDAYQLMVPRTADLNPKGSLSKLLSDDSEIIRVAAAGALNVICDRVEYLLAHPEEACPPQESYLHLERLRQVKQTLRMIAQNRILEGGIGSSKLPLHPDEEDLLMELTQRG
jgi:hypothetical protein